MTLRERPFLRRNEPVFIDAVMKFLEYPSKKAFTDMKRTLPVVLVLLFLASPAAVQAQFTYTTNDDAITLAGYNGTGGAVLVSNFVTSIGADAFSDCQNLTSVTIPDSVASIGDDAFNTCTGLTSVTIPGSVTSIGLRAFGFCWRLTNVMIPGSVISIGLGAFVDCESLTSVSIPSSVTSIGPLAFNECFSLTAISVDSQNSFYSSVNGVLFDKSQSTLVQYPDGKGGSYTIPDSVRNIGPYSFYNCDSLTSVTIQGSVSSIGDDAFNTCTGLTSVYFTGNAPTVGSGVFSFDNNGTVYYLPGATGWSSPFAGLPAVLLNPVSSPPSIVAPPTSQTAQAGHNVSFAIIVTGSLPLNYQWRFNGQNIAGATDSTLTLNAVSAGYSGGYSVIVSNPYGSVSSTTASLAVLTDGANGQAPNQISVSPVPRKPASKDSLVVITHGWEPLQPNADLSWMISMSNAIQSRVSDNWAITNVVWLQDAIYANPELVLAAAEIHGRLYGQQLASQGWSHIHFIGHSAGAALIENAASEVPFSTTVHCTFLDPFVGLLLELQSEYGADAAWADCYFTQDISGGWTGGGLPHAYNVDVDWLDPDHVALLYVSSLIAVSTHGFASHGYPIDFYTQTVTDTDATWCAAGYGFALSAEAGGETKWSSHSTGNGDSPVVLCGPPGAIPSPTLPVAVIGVTVDQVSHAVSDAATAVVNGAGFVLHSIWSALPLVKSGGIHPLGGPVPQDGGNPASGTNAPAWLAMGVTITNMVNCVQFDAGFTDTNTAQGFLTVYWNTNEIGMVDERVASAGLQTYRFGLPGTVTTGLYALSFRLDSFDNSSSITVTNIATGFVGLTQPVTLGVSLTNNAPLVRLTAATNFTYLVQSSTNLVDWTPAAVLLNTNGTAQFIDSAATGSSARFYRAVVP